jgi:hypothetical protein
MLSSLSCKFLAIFVSSPGGVDWRRRWLFSPLLGAGFVLFDPAPLEPYNHFRRRHVLRGRRHALLLRHVMGRHVRHFWDPHR